MGPGGGETLDGSVHAMWPVTGDLPQTQQPQPTQTRQMYIRKDVELAKYGYTPGCEGCVAAATNQRPHMHSAECRTRIEQAMKAANDESRLIEAGLRQAVASDGQGVALNTGSGDVSSSLASTHKSVEREEIQIAPASATLTVIDQD